MQNSVLIDSGPLIALFDRGDNFHQKVLTFLETFEGELLTTWAVMTEVTHMFDFNLNVQLDFLKWVELGGMTIYDIQQRDLAEIIAMMTKYTNVPMDLADSSLMFVAHKEGIDKIITIDSDFDIYRIGKRKVLNNLLR